ncbi:MAG TPA: DNA-directed RNA polymerase subunit omega [Clostridiales bacterium]|nr:MAG: DNA-directed RNA polymerase subunit omega [Clostridiales bacterium GWD2_32_19]HCC07185.1 DNA-directed RNA polymerase subunit omega [Clostridiales bacterium]
MLRPSYEDILSKINETTGEEKFDSKYSVVIAISKRAREIILENDTSTDKIVKPVSKAIKEIYAQKIVVNRVVTE